MTRIISKGTVFKLSISSVLTPIAQVISCDTGTAQGETFEADTLDNTSAGIPYDPTGRSEGDSWSGELFFDPVLANHQAITTLITTPAKRDIEIQYADAATTQWGGSAAGWSFGVTVALPDGLKANFSAKLSGIPGWPAA